MHGAPAAQQLGIQVLQQFGRQMQFMFLKGLLIFVLIVGPAAVIAYLLGTRYRKQVLGTFPFLDGYVLQGVLIVRLLIANFTYLPALLRWFRP